MSDSRRPHDDQELVRRICGEFLEMPGLRLTCEQAQRLFGLGEHTCRWLLEELVAHKFLARKANGMYLRLSSGRADVGARRHEEHTIALERPA